MGFWLPLDDPKFVRRGELARRGPKMPMFQKNFVSSPFCAVQPLPDGLSGARHAPIDLVPLDSPGTWPCSVSVRNGSFRCSSALRKQVLFRTGAKWRASR